jgi:hypothetical protein
MPSSQAGSYEAMRFLLLVSRGANLGTPRVHPHGSLVRIYAVLGG